MRNTMLHRMANELRMQRERPMKKQAEERNAWVAARNARINAELRAEAGEDVAPSVSEMTRETLEADAAGRGM